MAGLEDPPDNVPPDEGKEEEEVFPSCTHTSCIIPGNRLMLECKKCKGRTHYACTYLPSYQLALFLQTGYRKWLCPNCVGIIHAGTMEHSVEVMLQKLHKKIKELETELSCKAKAPVQTEHGELNTDKVQLRTENMRLKKSVSILEAKVNSDIESYEQSMASYEESERDLKAQIVKQKIDLKNQEEMFNEAGNPDYDKFANLEQSMNNKLDILGNNLRDLLSKQLEDNGKTLRVSLSKQIEIKLNEVSKSYSQSISNGQASAFTSVPTLPEDLRSIMQEQNNQRLVEENDKKGRSCNIIVHRVEEPTSDDKDQAKKSDEDFFTSLRETIGVGVTVKSLSRIGRLDRSKNRPIKVVLQSEEDKNKIMENLRNLKDKAEYKGISVSEDYTVAERESIRKIAEEVRAKNLNESADSKYVYKIRGTPKNGLQIKRFQKCV